MCIRDRLSTKIYLHEMLPGSFDLIILILIFLGLQAWWIIPIIKKNNNRGNKLREEIKQLEKLYKKYKILILRKNLDNFEIFPPHLEKIFKIAIAPKNNSSSLHTIFLGGIDKSISIPESKIDFSSLGRNSQ